MNLAFRDEVFRAQFRPTLEMEEFESFLRPKLGFKSKYESARLCIGRSLAEPLVPPPLGSDAQRGKAISGEILFGAEIDLWIAAVVMDGELGSIATIEDFRALVEAHWARGGKLLREQLQECKDDETELLRQLSNLLPEDETGAGLPDGLVVVRVGEVRLKVGSVSRTHPDGVDVDFVLNGPGTAPHIALMGKAGSGKTTTGVHLAQQIVDAASVPMLFIDPKGEFVDGDRLIGPLADFKPAPSAIEVGREAIPLDFLPDPGIGSASIMNASMQFRDSLALCCQGAGDIQKGLLLDSVQDVIRSSQVRGLAAVRDAYEARLTASGKMADSVLNRLRELTSLQIFDPSMSPANFFSRSWVVSLKTLQSEELRRLVVLLMLDAAKAFVLSQPDSQIQSGYRALRHLLVIDEARRILMEKRYQSLVDLVRQGRSKGEVVILLSQDPSDFEGQADDFTTQLGTVVAFACAQSQKGLRSLQGAFGRKLQPQEFSDTQLPTGVAFVKLPGRQAERVACWLPAQDSQASGPQGKRKVISRFG